MPILYGLPHPSVFEVRCRGQDQQGNMERSPVSLHNVPNICAIVPCHWLEACNLFRDPVAIQGTQVYKALVSRS